MVSNQLPGTRSKSWTINTDIHYAEPEAGQKEVFASWALFILIVLLIVALFTSYLLQMRKIQAVHETSLSIFAGMVIGLILRLTAVQSVLGAVSFDYQFFFNLLLPPIILASGYELHQGNFFRNIGTILTFAFAGTFISAVVLGVILYLWTRIPLEGLDITFVEAMSVGATLSATDPVTILAIFNTYKVDPQLYTVIFGESILNDAIAIVLFETAQKYREGAVKGHLTVLSLFESIGVFLLVFFGSLVIGLVVGIGTSLLLKYTLVRRFPKIESCLVLLIAYASYFFSNAIHMSGKFINLSYCGCPTNIPRHRLSPLLWNLHETLRLPQHVSPNSAYHQIHLPGHGTTVREFHLHLSWAFPLHRIWTGVQAAVHLGYRRRNLRRTLLCCLSTVFHHQLVHQISRSKTRSRGR